MSQKNINTSGYNKGDSYENKIYQICKMKNIVPDGQTRAGASNKSDLIVIHNGENIAIEVKSNGADYGQKYLEYRDDNWNWSQPDSVTKIYDHMNVIGMIDPNFIPYNANHKNLSNKEWAKQKKIEITADKKAYDQNKFEKNNIPLSLDIFFEYYKKRNCYYLQIDGFGFYHMYEDKYNLGTQQFDGGIHLRLRAKSIHAHQYCINEKNIKTKTKYLEKKEESTNQDDKFLITETPWWYRFLAVIKANTKPTPSMFSIDANTEQKFPNFL